MRLNAKVDSTSNTPIICAELSWNGGITWTTPKTTGILETRSKTYILRDPIDIGGILGLMLG